MAKVFVSHSVKDRVFVEDHIVDFLRKQGVDTWYSPDNIDSASQWEKTTRDALDKCDWFLVVLTPNSVASSWVQAEVHWAMDHRADHFVPVLAKDCQWQDLHLMLRTRQLVFLDKNLEEGKAKLLSVWEEELLPMVRGSVKGKVLDEPVMGIMNYSVNSNVFVPIVLGMSNFVTEIKSSTVLLPDLIARADQSQLISVEEGKRDNSVCYFFASGNLITVLFEFRKSGGHYGRDAFKNTYPLPCRATSTRESYLEEPRGITRLIGCEDGYLRLFDQYSEDEIVSLKTNNFPIISLATSRRSLIVSGDVAGNVNVWSKKSLKLLHTVNLSSQVYSLDIDSNNSQILACVGDGHFYILDYEGTVLSTFRVSDKPVKHTQLISSEIIVISTGSTLELWNYQKKRRLHHFPINEGTISALQLDPNWQTGERDLLVGFKDGSFGRFAILDPRSPYHRKFIRRDIQ